MSIAVVLGGGRGTRLYPLTKYRSKPAVPLAGKYRLIDIPLSNCINSGLNQIYVLTQFHSVSLHRHIRRTYRFDPFSGGFVEILAAQQTMTKRRHDWYQGTADAVRKNLRYIAAAGHRLRADPLRRSALPDGLRRHAATHQRLEADVTIAGMPVDRADGRGARHHAGRRHGPRGRLPRKAARPTRSSTSCAWTRPGSTPAASQASGRDCLASMGIYLFNRDTLVDAAGRRPTTTTSARKSSRPSIRAGSVQVHLFDGYWEDIGTIHSFYEANLSSPAESAVRLGLGHGADLHPAAVPAADAHRRRDDQATA